MQTKRSKILILVSHEYVQVGTQGQSDEKAFCIEQFEHIGLPPRLHCSRLAVYYSAIKHLRRTYRCSGTTDTRQQPGIAPVDT